MHEVTDIKAKLKDYLFIRQDVLAVWEGGSAATGYLDEYSDLDLCIVIGDKDVEPIFQSLEDYFEQTYGIIRQFRLPEPTWHGMSQCFYLLDKCPDLFYCDIAVVTRDNPKKFTEPDRHGNALIWFDKDQVYSAVPTPESEIRDMAIRTLKSVTALDFLSIIELRKALKRRNWIAAQMNWQMFINRCLVPLLNIRWRPWKADFGIRYVERDYPQEVIQRLEALLHYDTVDDIATHSESAIAWYEGLKAELGAQYLT